MNNRSRGFRVPLFYAPLVFVLTAVAYTRAPERPATSRAPSCGNSITVAINPNAAPPDVFVCPGGSVTWSGADVIPPIDFHISFKSSPLTSKQPTPSMPHPPRTPDFYSDTTTHMVTGYDASDGSPSNCPAPTGGYCYKYSVAINDGGVFDPHVIIMPPTN
jgi:hypothetical protein